jgi:hypothetical protein
MALPPLLATLFCRAFSSYAVSAVQASLAFLLLIIPWSSYLIWKREKRREVPLFAMIAMMHWVYFALPLFWGGRSLPGGPAEAPEELITTTLAMALLGVACLWLGMQTHIELWRARTLPDLTDSPMSWTYLRALMLGGILISFWSSSAYAFGEGGRQMVLIVQTILPSTIFAFFLRKYLRGEAPRIDRALVFAFLASRVLVGLSSGWLGTVVWPGVICILVYIAEGRPIPVKAAALVLGCVLFLQTGKAAFRGVYWGGQTEGTTSEKIQFWIEQSASKWTGAIHGDDSAASGKLAYQTVSRLSLLTQAAHVLDWTPDTVPYQYGRTYSYMLITLIPRFMWPEKPSMSEANQFYQVQYGLTAENQLDTVSIAVGFLTEGYINFGWLGVVGVAYFVGLALGIFQRTFLGAESGMLFGSLGLALVPGFLALESQLTQYFSGFVQQVGLIFIILLPVMRRRAGNLPGHASIDGGGPADVLLSSQ